MTVCSKQLLGPHRYYDKWGNIQVSGLPQNLNVPSLFINESNIQYNDHYGKKCIFYEKQKDRPGKTYGLKKTREWYHINEGKSVRLVVRNASNEYDYRYVTPIAFNDTHIILKQ